MPEARTREAIGFLGAERRLPHGWQLATGFEGRAWHEPVRGGRSTLGVTVSATRASRSRGKVVSADVTRTGVFRRATLAATLASRAGSVRIFPRLRVGWGKNLPLRLGIPLGGNAARAGRSSIGRMGGGNAGRDRGGNTARAVRFEYGLVTGGRDALFVRMGRRF